MYRIIKEDGAELACVDAPRYIRLHENGCYVEADEMTAQGVAVNGVAYNLFGREALPSVVERVVVSKFDSGALVAEQQRIINGLLISSLEG